MNNEAQFIHFAKKYRGKFRRIAAATRREFEPDDVEGEAWWLDYRLRRESTPDGRLAPSFRAREFQCHSPDGSDSP